MTINEVKIDPEYNCVWAEENSYLSDHGIKYTFVKTVNGVTVWKYRKNERLFKTLADFYKNVYYR